MTVTPGSRAAAGSAEGFAELFKEALERGHRPTLNRLIRGLLDAAPRLGQRWKTMAAVSRENGELDDAWAAMQLYARDVGDSASVRYELAAVSAQMGFLTRAATLMRDVPDDIPTPAANAYIRGTMLTNLGQFVGAREALRRGVALDPLSGQSWLALAMVGEVESEDSRAIIAALPAMERAPDLERAAHCFAVGKVCHERGQFTKAFEFFDRGAKLVARQRPYRAADDEASALEAMQGWSPDAVGAVHARLGGEADAAGSSHPACPAVFVTGLPRSGTTLVEQILVSHSLVDDGDELGLLRIVADEVRGRSSPAVARWLEGGGSPRGLAELYAHLVRQRFPGARLVVDKSLDVSRYMGLTMSLFPDARFVWVRRDPHDCAWSAYRTWFLRGLDWSWSLEGIARHFRIEDRLFGFWSTRFPERVLVVDYERLVRSPESEIARLNSFCGLRMEPMQLQPHLKERAVTTASVSQVRQPINPSSLGVSVPYRTFMSAFTRAYAA